MLVPAVCAAVSANALLTEFGLGYYLGWWFTGLFAAALIPGALGMRAWRAGRPRHLWPFGTVVWLAVMLGRWALPEEDWQVSLVAAGVVSVILVMVILATLPKATPPPRSTVPAEALAAFNTWSEAVLQEGVLPILYTWINEATIAEHPTLLALREAPALVRADHVRMHVPTPASEELVRLVAGSEGGSFAVAGPRGAGKTHLLRAFCGGRYRDQTSAPDLAVLVSAPVEYVPHEFVLHLFAETCEAAIAHTTGHRTKRRPGPLASAAHENLVLLNYVRSYNREVGGKGGFKGFELNGKRAVTLAGRALTYPELVKRFRQFLALAAAELPGRVIVAIDELDRIGAGEPARRFLNEVKAVFDVPGCHYLVSVSTEAQYDFELSGIGLRSVFDSSFDEVVRVDYLDHRYAGALLRRYVLGLSAPFHALAYAMSGGLARQLVRTARAIVELGRERRARPLSEVAGTLVRAELLRTCRATADALTAVDDLDGVTALLRVLDEQPYDLYAYAQQVIKSYDGRSERVGRLRDAVGARVVFLATVLALFTDDVTEERLAAVDLDQLARARRYAGTNPAAGLDLLEDLRQRL
ncbi:hypothetical protein [Saccharothrix syringae]|uniref:AAA+ ATPase domain-containing protein n=1 Tax=Saccharothrix syringae TaxID=103733 RepID=A0A5Q0HAU6_SACSY|nr:hypothetical protein [Saccharothrix syringae]QFZ23065.1 hypothetical protein EKG83_41565 [Saccharothrix syringae]